MRTSPVRWRAPLKSSLIVDVGPRKGATDGERHEQCRRTWVWIGVGAFLSVLMRLRMLWSPVSVDEGGYLAIARGWAHGSVLYRDVWVDRPQGLLVLFRMWDWVSGGNTGSIRIMAMLFGVVLVAATAVTVRELVNPAAARWAAIVCGVVSAAPVLEGYEANGELLSGAMAATGLATAALALSKPQPLRWFFVSGIFAGVAVSLRQSGFDGLLAIGIWLFVGAVVVPSVRRDSLRSLGALAAGLSSVIAILMLHGALTGWWRWWTAVAGYRLRVQSAFSSAEWTNLPRTFPFAAAALGTSTAGALVGIGIIITSRVHMNGRLRLPRRSVVLIFWILACALAFLLGGGFSRHYWLLLAPPVSALAGVALSQAGRIKPLVLTCFLAPCIAISMWVLTADSRTILIRASGDHRSSVDEHVAKWFTAHRRPGDNLYVLCASAALYADAHQDPGYPYLWLTEVHQGPNARDLLVAYLGDPKRAPRYIAQYQRPTTCDSSGQVKRILKARYHQTATVDHLSILERDITVPNPKP